jgi:hypothetical protein
VTLEPPQNLVAKFLIELDLFYHPYVFYNISMRRFLIMIFLLPALSCWCLFLPFFKIITPATLTPLPLTATTIPPLSTPTQISSFTPNPQSPTFTPVPSATPNPSLKPFSVLFHPDDLLYVGDQVSFEVISPPGMDVKDADVRVQVDPPGGLTLGPVNFGPWGIQGRNEATMLWSWDTQNLAPGSHTLSFNIPSKGYQWTEQVTLLPSSDMPTAQAAAQWSSTQTQCCTVFYITNTASERDLPSLTTIIDAQAQDAINKMGADFTQPITITVLPRLLGHGGFTSSEISVSYLDRNYASNSWALVVHHEMIHAIDGHLGGDFRPTIFVEGLAVYMTGGHYKPEPFMPRAATLLPNYLNRYIPLKNLADDFYGSQHEIGYIEGSSLIEYMVKTYGLDAFLAFYRDIHNHQGESQSDSIDAALQVHFSITYSQLEQDFLAALNNETTTADWVDDVRLTITFYDTMRRYQQLLDPSAYFRTAWLLDNKTMRERGIVADYLRHPHTPANLALETLLIAAHQQMAAQEYTSASQTLEVINSVLDAIEHTTPDPFSVSLLSANYFSISTTLQQQDYEVQSITIHGDTASTDVTTYTGLDLLPLNLQRIGGQWSILP